MLVTSPSAGEATSPLIWLALALALATVSAIAIERRSIAVRIAFALLHGGAVLAAAALVLALVSPTFVPPYLR